ncbi:response regulator transcription factor [Adlercreutzia sp. ZJ138]|uniref:response regulator transcription factor n=1 Tax=Adlercreutzia sp. ZJ138 TaxID=2709405 RepID=UPI0013EA9740|nr:helix-turn-helix transcriptional regulator [Adlercreutzia sp. ZJ138]
MSPTQDRHEQKRSFADSALAFPSSLYWAWAILSLFCPLLFEGSQLNPRECEAYFIVCALTGSATAFVSYKSSKIALGFLSSLKTEVAVVGAASLGSALMLAGVFIHAFPLLIIGGVIIGCTNVCFALAWGRMYAQRGSETSSIVLCLALAIGIAIAGLVTLLPFPAAAACTIIMPEAIVGLLVTIRSIVSVSDKDSDAQAWEQGESIGGSAIFITPKSETYGTSTAEQIFWKTSRLILGMSPSLASACVLIGVCVGFLNGQIIALSESFFASGTFTALDAFTPVHLVVLSVVVLAFWASMFFAPRIASSALMVVAVVGLAGYLCAPTAELTGLLILSYLLTLLGLAGLFVAVWLAMTELSYQVGNDIAVGLGAGLALAALGTALGTALHIALGLAPVTAVGTTLVSSATGLLYACSILLLFVGNSELWGLVKEYAFMTPRSANPNHNDLTGFRPDFANRIGRLAEEHGLTEREKEVLSLLLTGRSRPRIAEILVLSENTVSSHIQHIYRKFNVHSNQELLDDILNTK